MEELDRNAIVVEGIDRVFDRRKVLLVLLLPLSMALMSISSVNVALPTIKTGLEASSADVQWVLAGYGLAFGALLTPAGRLGDVMGRGTWFIVGLVLFIVGSLACGLAPHPAFLNVARLVQGLGAGVFSPQVTGMIQQYFHGGGRAKAFGLFGLVISASVAFAPVLAGGIISAIGDEWGWRWAFLFNLPLGLLAMVLALLWFPFETERKRKRQPRGSAARLDLDPIGVLLVVGTVLCVMLPWMGEPGLQWVLLPLGPVLLWLWVRWERRYKARGGEPMVDLNLFKFPSFRNGIAVAGTMFLGSASIFAVVAIFLQQGVGRSALETGLISLPNAIASGAASVLIVRHVMKYGHLAVVWSLAAMASGVALTGVVALCTVEFDWPWWLIAFPLMLVGVGMGGMGSSNQTISLRNVPTEHGGTAGGIKQTVERVGAALGNAMVTGLLFGSLRWGWGVAALVAYGAILLFCLVALVLSVLDWRQAQRA